MLEYDAADAAVTASHLITLVALVAAVASVPFGSLRLTVVLLFFVNIGLGGAIFAQALRGVSSRVAWTSWAGLAALGLGTSAFVVGQGMRDGLTIIVGLILAPLGIPLLIMRRGLCEPPHDPLSDIRWFIQHRASFAAFAAFLGCVVAGIASVAANLPTPWFMLWAVVGGVTGYMVCSMPNLRSAEDVGCLMLVGYLLTLMLLMVFSVSYPAAEPFAVAWFFVGIAWLVWVGGAASLRQVWRHWWRSKMHEQAAPPRFADYLTAATSLMSLLGLLLAGVGLLVGGIDNDIATVGLLLVTIATPGTWLAALLRRLKTLVQRLLAYGGYVALLAGLPLWLAGVGGEDQFIGNIGMVLLGLGGLLYTMAWLLVWRQQPAQQPTPGRSAQAE
ncbi:MAG: hypothetical protein MUD01_08445 [Chloroflexaceae bacterium]|nr:hypothetical protein [Chloroflexaceae bacterium]